MNEFLHDIIAMNQVYGHKICVVVPFRYFIPDDLAKRFKDLGIWVISANDGGMHDAFKCSGCEFTDLYIFDVSEATEVVAYLKTRLRSRNERPYAIHMYSS